MMPWEEQYGDSAVSMETANQPDSDTMPWEEQYGAAEVPQQQTQQVDQNQLAPEQQPQQQYDMTPEEIQAQQESAARGSEAPKQERSIFDKAVGAGETVLSMLSGSVAAPVAGVAGSADLATGGGLKGSTDTIKNVTDALTYEPKGEAGKEYTKNVGEFLEPVAKTIKDAGEYLGDATREATGSYILGGLAQSIPDAVLELIGVKGAGKIARPRSGVSASPRAALSQSAPEIKTLRKEASDLYNAVDESGVMVPKAEYQDLGIKLNNIARRYGYDDNLTPKMSGFLERVANDYKKDQIKLSDIDQLRKVAQIPANAIENATDAALGSRMISAIDEFMDTKGAKIAEQGGQNVGLQYGRARNLTSRVKKAELLDEATFKAGEAKSGFENGLRSEFSSILKSKKKRRGFNSEEIKAMQKITQGGKLENTMKRLSKLGFGADQQTNVLANMVASFGSATAFGPAGVILPTAVGQVAANISKRLGKNNQKFANALVRSGGNGLNIAKAYIKEIPRTKQSAAELAGLLLDPDVTIGSIRNMGSSMAQEAAYIADRIRKAQAAGAIAAQEVSNYDGDSDTVKK